MCNGLTVPHGNHARVQHKAGYEEVHTGLRLQVRTGRTVRLPREGVCIELSRFRWLLGILHNPPWLWFDTPSHPPSQLFFSFKSLLKHTQKDLPDQGLPAQSHLSPTLFSHSQLYGISSFMNSPGLSPTPLRDDYTDDGRTVYDNKSLTHNRYGNQPRTVRLGQCLPAALCFIPALPTQDQSGKDKSAPHSNHIGCLQLLRQSEHT